MEPSSETSHIAAPERNWKHVDIAFKSGVALGVVLFTASRGNSPIDIASATAVAVGAATAAEGMGRFAVNQAKSAVGRVVENVDTVVSSVQQVREDKRHEKVMNSPEMKATQEELASLRQDYADTYEVLERNGIPFETVSREILALRRERAGQAESGLRNLTNRIPRGGTRR